MGEIVDKGLLSPEFQIMNPLTATTLPNRMWYLIQNGFHDARPAVTPKFELELESIRLLTGAGAGATLLGVGAGGGVTLRGAGAGVLTRRGAGAGATFLVFLGGVMGADVVGVVGIEKELSTA